MRLGEAAERARDVHEVLRGAGLAQPFDPPAPSAQQRGFEMAQAPEPVRGGVAREPRSLLGEEARVRRLERGAALLGECLDDELAHETVDGERHLLRRFVSMRPDERVLHERLEPIEHGASLRDALELFEDEGVGEERGVLQHLAGFLQEAPEGAIERAPQRRVRLLERIDGHAKLLPNALDADCRRAGGRELERER